MTSEVNVDDYHKNEFRRISIEEVFGDYVQKLFSTGNDTVDYNFQRKFGRDQLEGTVRFKRDELLKRYDISYLELHLQKADTMEKIGQRFYFQKLREVAQRDGSTIKHSFKVTVREGYNLLSGRAIRKLMLDKNNVQIDSWIRLNLNELSPITRNHKYIIEPVASFDLKEVLRDYTISENRHHALIKSLERGDLAMATFLNNKSETERLYISPDTNKYCLNLYTHERRPVSLKEQKELGIIHPSLIKRLEQIPSTRELLKEITSHTLKRRQKIW